MLVLIIVLMTIPNQCDLTMLTLTWHCYSQLRSEHSCVMSWYVLKGFGSIIIVELLQYKLCAGTGPGCSIGSTVDLHFSFPAKLKHSAEQDILYLQLLQ